MTWHAEKYVAWDGPEPGDRELIAECETIEFAKLIAAAPDLLEALEDLLKWVEPIAGDNRDVTAERIELATVAAARAAISKARGKP